VTVGGNTARVYALHQLYTGAHQCKPAEIAIRKIFLSLIYYEQYNKYKLKIEALEHKKIIA